MPRTEFHVGDVGGIPRRYVMVEALCELKHCSTTTPTNLLKSYATLCTLQPWQSTLEEEATRTAIHFGDLGGVPERDVLVEARGAIEHCGKATKELSASVSAQHDHC